VVHEGIQRIKLNVKCECKCMTREIMTVYLLEFYGDKKQNIL